MKDRYSLGESISRNPPRIYTSNNTRGSQTIPFAHLSDFINVCIECHDTLMSLMLLIYLRSFSYVLEYLLSRHILSCLRH